MNLNPIERWSPQQARLHPFITGEKFTKPFVVSYDNLNLSMAFFSCLIISPLVTLHNRQVLLRPFRQPRLHRILNVHLAGLFHLNPRVHEHTRMLPLTTSTLPSTRLTPPRPRLPLRPQIMCSVILISQRNYSRSRHPPYILPLLLTLGTHIRNHRSHNTLNMRQVHRVGVAYLVLGSCMLMPFFRAKQCQRGATAVL